MDQGAFKGGKVGQHRRATCQHGPTIFKFLALYNVAPGCPATAILSGWCGRTLTCNSNGQAKTIQDQVN